MVPVNAVMEFCLKNLRTRKQWRRISNSPVSKFNNIHSLKRLKWPWDTFELPEWHCFSTTVKTLSLISPSIMSRLNCFTKQGKSEAVRICCPESQWSTRSTQQCVVKYNGLPIKKTVPPIPWKIRLFGTLMKSKWLAHFSQYPQTWSAVESTWV